MYDRFLHLEAKHLVVYDGFRWFSVMYDFSISSITQLKSEQTIDKQNHRVCTCFALMRACLAMMSLVFAPATSVGGFKIDAPVVQKNLSLL